MHKNCSQYTILKQITENQMRHCHAVLMDGRGIQEYVSKVLLSQDSRIKVSERTNTTCKIEPRFWFYWTNPGCSLFHCPLIISIPYHFNFNYFSFILHSDHSFLLLSSYSLPHCLPFTPLPIHSFSSPFRMGQSSHGLVPMSSQVEAGPSTTPPTH